jgi:hypothetical protein
MITEICFSIQRFFRKERAPSRYDLARFEQGGP